MNTRTNGQTNLNRRSLTATHLTVADMQRGGGVDPVELPEASRIMKTDELRELGLPWGCHGGSIVQDLPATDAADVEDEETRVVFWELNGEYLSVHYVRPVDTAIDDKFEPWPGEDTVLITLYDKGEDDQLHMREVGDGVDALH